mmetsp:Transcript_73999/g.176120  ORF Transcript_73999/g.176120 Transcript_73999/m.176120 type:complete len:153 (-) Transcript_73999:38-496(-)
MFRQVFRGLSTPSRFAAAGSILAASTVVTHRNFRVSAEGADTSDRFEHLDGLWATIMMRKRENDPSSSWTAKLLAKGADKCAQKVGEEAVEVAIEASARRREGVVSESADLLYHLLVLWASLDIQPREVFAVLIKRQGISGIAEKQSRSAAQ